MNRKKKAGQVRSMKPLETNPLDYPITMSGYERDSLAAEAKLAAEKKKKISKPNGKSIPYPR